MSAGRLGGNVSTLQRAAGRRKTRDVQEVSPPRLVIPPRRAPAPQADIIDRAKELLGQFRKELKSIRIEQEKLNENWGLQTLAENCGGGVGYPDAAVQPYTMANSANYSPITMQHILLNYQYASNGLVRSVIDVVVEDAFRGGLKYKSKQLDDDELALLNRRVNAKQSRNAGQHTPMADANVRIAYDLSKPDVEAIKTTAKWARLFGGSGLIINSDADFKADFHPEQIREDSPLTFISADRWELTLMGFDQFDTSNATQFNYYGLPLNQTRVCKMMGLEAPSFVRTRLQGWGLSVLEECIRQINAFIKFEALIFELVDEAKIDVLKIQGFNTQLLTDAGTEAITRRVLLANQLKNYQNALVMDKDDDFEQKQLTFSGLADIWGQLRLSLCAALKIPENKLFGQSAGGFASGKDALDNYNSTVDITRANVTPLCVEVGELRCQQLFGMIPDDLEVAFVPLAVLDGVETEAVKTSQQKRIVEQFTTGLLTDKEAVESLRKNELIDIDKTEVEMGLRDAVPPVSSNPDEVEAGRDHEIAMEKERGKNKPKPASKKK